MGSSKASTKKTKLLSGGYRAISYQYGNSTKAALRQSFFKSHSTKHVDPELPKGKTIFVLNPPQVEGAIEQLFAEFGEVVSVSATRLDGAGTTVMVVFEESDSVSAALNVSNKVFKLEGPDKSKYGMAKWIKAYEESIIDQQQLQASVDTAMEQFDDKTAKRKADKLAMHGTEDDEGWITITKTGAGGHEHGVTATAKAQKSKAGVKKDKKHKEIQNFYAWQRKAARQDQIASLRQKFDQDKLKIQSLRDNRKFKPY